MYYFTFLVSNLSLNLYTDNKAYLHLACFRIGRGTIRLIRLTLPTIQCAVFALTAHERYLLALYAAKPHSTSLETISTQAIFSLTCWIWKFSTKYALSFRFFGQNVLPYKYYLTMKSCQIVAGLLRGWFWIIVTFKSTLSQRILERVIRPL